MKALLKTYAPVALTLVIISLPLVALAQPLPGTTNVQPPLQGNTNNLPPLTGNTNQTSICTGGSCQLKNPLQVGNFCDLVKVVLSSLIVIGMPIAVLFLVIVGFKFIIARGNPEELAKARQNFLYTIIGIAIFLGAWAIAKIISATLAGLGVSGANACV